MVRTDDRIGRLLVGFARDTPGLVAAVVVGADGLRLAATPGADDAQVDQLAATASGLVSLARATAQLLGSGHLTQTILEMTGGYLFVTAVDRGATLVVHADRQCDLGLIGYEMTMLAARVGHAVDAKAHTTDGGST
jgi:uncharacterized protein